MRLDAGEQLRDSAKALRAVVSNADIRRLELSWLGMIGGQWAYVIGLAVYAYDQGGSTAVGVVALVRVLPAAVAAPFAAGLGDRLPRERVLLVAAVLNTATMVAAAAAVSGDAPAAAVYALAGFQNLVSVVFRPLQGALLPLLARSPEELTAANLGFATIESVGIFAGPALGGVLLATTSTATVFAVTAAIFLVATVLLGRVAVSAPAEAPRERAGLLREAVAGFRAIALERSLRLLVALYGAQTLVAGALNVLIVISALELLEIGKSGVGFMNSAVGVGGLLGAVVAVALVGRQRLASDFGFGLVLLGLPIALIGVFPQPPVALILLGVVGIGVTVVDTAGVTLLQRVVPDEILARVFGVLQTVFVTTVGIGGILAPALSDAVGIRGALVATGALLPVLTALLWRRLTALDTRAPAPARELALLRRIPLFRPLPPATLDQLASSLIPLQAPAGTEVIREGEAGDRFYVIASGEVEVSAQGRHAATLREGDYFGEIALLRDVPRTATVTAKSDVELYALERDEFLSAVTGHPASAEAADAVIATRLAGLRPGIASV